MREYKKGTGDRPAHKTFSAILTILFVLNSLFLFSFVLTDQSVQNTQGTWVNTIFSDNMEPGGPAGSGQWTVIDDVWGFFPPPPSTSRWELGIPLPPPSAYSPTNVWGTYLAGPYEPPSECILVTPTIDLSSSYPDAIISAKLTFQHWYNFSNYDGGWVEINPSQLNLNPQIIIPEGGYDGNVYNMRPEPMPGYLSGSDTWEQAVFDLSDYLGQSFKIGFHFCGYLADGIARGWYIDDVKIQIELRDGPYIEQDMEMTGLPGNTLSYDLTVWNFNFSADFIDLKFLNLDGWYVQILNATTLKPLESLGGDPRYPDVYLMPNSSINIVVNITIPSWITDWGVSSITSLYAMLSSAPSKSHIVKLVSKTPYPDVGIDNIKAPTMHRTGTLASILVTVINHDTWTHGFFVEGALSGPMINPPITLEPKLQYVTDLPPKTTTVLTWSFIPTVTCRYTFSATTLLDIDLEDANNRSSAEIQVLDLIWSDNMESGGDASQGLWDDTSHAGPATKWELGTPSWPYFPPDGPPAGSLPSPNNCWGTDIDNAYQKGTDCFLFTPASSAFDFTGRYTIFLNYYQWFNIQEKPIGDIGEIVYTLTPSISTIYYTGISYKGTSGGWEHTILDLSEFVKNRPYVRFGWRLNQGAGSLQKFCPGWYIDDVKVWASQKSPNLIITEIVDSAAEEYIEVYNNGGLPAILSDYSITLDRGMSFLSSGSWSTSTVPSGGYAYYSISAGLDELENQGDTLYVVNISSSLGLITDEIGYGQKGWVPDPLPGESVARYWDIDKYRDIWARNPTPTIGNQNNAPGEVGTKYVVLNEVLYNPSVPQNGFIELIYVGKPGDPSINVLNWLLVVGDSVIPVPSGAYSTNLNSANPFYVINATMVPGLFGAVDVNGDNIYLYTNSGAFVDEVGWSLPHTTGMSMSRVPDGYGVMANGKPFGLLGYDDQSSIAAGWVFDRQPTVPYVRIGPDGSEGRNFPGNYAVINLTVENRQFVGDLLELYNFTANGFTVEFYDATNTFKLTDSDGDGNPDLFLAAQGSVNITVRVHIPETFPIPDINHITVYIQSDTNPMIGDFANLKVITYPYLEPKKTITPSTIFVKGTGYGEEAQITLGVKGSGMIIPGVMRNEADIVFVVDDTGSMGSYIQQVKEQIDYIVERILENITSVRFGLVTYKDQNEIDYDIHLTFDVDAFMDAVWNMVAEGGGDYEEAVEDALETARDDSNWRGDPVVRIMILMGDADPHDPAKATAVADDAYVNHGIFTNVVDCNLRGLQSFIDIASAGRGIYEKASIGEKIAEAIINSILYLVPPVDIAGEDINQADSDFMIQDVLPPYIEYVPGSFSLEPDEVFVDVQGRTLLKWNIQRIRIGEDWSITFSITSSDLGLVDSNDFFLSRINYTRWDSSFKSSLFPKTQVYVTLPEPEAPQLSIDVVDDTGSVNGRGDNIRLSWIPPASPKIAYYLIYRSENQTEFDFSTPWARTDVNPDNGLIPLRTTFNDTGVSAPDDVNYKTELYYTIRAVNEIGMTSSNSRTVGKWTRPFSPGISSFSLPLEPLQILDSDYYSTDMGAEYIRWMEPSSGIWIKHKIGDGANNNSDIFLGRGYEVKLSSYSNYTFCGMPGSMIRWDNKTAFGFDSGSDARSLEAIANPVTRDVILTWQRPSGMTVGVDFYYIYYSSSRDGFWGEQGIDYQILGGTHIYVGEEFAFHLGAALADTQFYYMVVPVRASDLYHGASTYTIGVFTSGYKSGYNTLGIPLKQSLHNSADWYCDNIPDTVGINYLIYGEQRWGWHSTRMPKGAFDTTLVMAEGYQISTITDTYYTFCGV